MRITNTQISTLENILIINGVDREQFQFSRTDETIRYEFISDYFSFEITKQRDDLYLATRQTVFSKQAYEDQFTWEVTQQKFTAWIQAIKRDIESGTKINKPPVTLPVPEDEEYIMTPTIKRISPKFALIFDQAMTAEHQGLNEICGLGYRKAFEFLIKDYVMRSMTSEEATTIKNMGINDVVKNHILDTNIRLMLHRIIWLGNDHAHYVPVWKNKTINDLKRLIYTTMNWIELNEKLAKISKQAGKLEKSMPHKPKKAAK